MGGPLGIGPYAGHRKEVFSVWRSALQNLAQHSSIRIKLGGLGMPRIGFAFDRQRKPPSSDQLASEWAPYIHTCVEIFGPDRCMFESNFPVDKGMCSYVVLCNAYKKVLRALSTPSATQYSMMLASILIAFGRMSRRSTNLRNPKGLEIEVDLPACARAQASRQGERIGGRELSVYRILTPNLEARERMHLESSCSGA